MERKKINVYTKLNKIEENNEFLAIKSDDVIKYIDLEDNKMVIDMEKNIIRRENIDYTFILDFMKNNINITVKSLKKSFDKSIKTLLIEKTKKSYLVRYLLEDENELNEYFIDF